MEHQQPTTESAGDASHDERVVKRFEMVHKFFGGEPERFSEVDAPDWLTSVNTRPGSTMDHRWFWDRHVLTLQVGQSVETDFQIVTRVE